MITLEDICKKLDRVLNGTDPEISAISPTTNNYFFKVYSEGLYLSNVDDKIRKKNFIPVIVGALGGEHNPVPNLAESSYNVQITLYFPVRFKTDMYALENYLETVFVGKTLTYNFQKALSNISIAQFGEIQGLDFKAIERDFDEKPLTVMEAYWCMQFTLFLKEAYNLGLSGGVMLGNDVQIEKIKITYDGITEGEIVLEDTSPINIERAVIANSEPAVQQCFGDTHSKGFPANAGYTKQLPLIVKNTSQYSYLINICEIRRDIQKLKVEIFESLPFDGPGLHISHKYFVSGYSRKNVIGDYVGISLTLNDLEE